MAVLPPPLPARDGISPRRVVLRGVVDNHHEYVAGQSGDGDFAYGDVIPAGTTLRRPQPAWYYPTLDPEPTIPTHYRVVYEDRRIIVVDKPHFLPTTSNGRFVVNTVQTRLRREFGQDSIVPAHRLDRLTAGLVLCVRNSEDRAAYQQLFARGLVRKWYMARVHHPEVLAPVQDVSIPLATVRGQRQVEVRAGKRTRTLVQRSRRDWVNAYPRTGFTHQIRATLDWLGAPIVGDDTYPLDAPRPWDDFSTPLELFACGLDFVDPVTGKTHRFRRPLPAD